MTDDVLQGRGALVTGAASGIGRAIAQRLADGGAQVLAVDLQADDGAPGVPFAADLTTREGNHRAVDAALERFGGLDFLVPCAGVQHVAPVADFDEDRWDQLVALMLTSPFLLARRAWPALKERNGSIVAIGSAHSLVASPFKSAYVSAKHGLLGLFKVLALEGADVGITASVICPGYVRTPLVEKQIESQAEVHGIPAERVLEEVILAPHAVKRLIEPQEVAEAVVFLLSPAGRACTGAPLILDQGWSAR
jgi:3-hydroxybutyrate dehydrogenase